MQKNNHYDLLIQNNSTKAIYHIDGLNESTSVLFVKIPFDFKKEYEIINDGLVQETRGILHSGEYTYALFWNTLDIEFVSSMEVDLLKVKVKIPDGNGDFMTAELKDLHPDVGLAKVVNPDDPTQEVYTDNKENNENNENYSNNLYYSLD